MQQLPPRELANRLMRGFTLVETLVGAAIFGLLFAGILAAVGNGARTIRATQGQQKALRVLVEKAEQLRMSDWASLTNGGTPLQFAVPQHDDEANCPHLMYGTVTIAPKPFTEDYATNLLLVRFDLQWGDSDAKRSNYVETLVARNGIWTLQPQ